MSYSTLKLVNLPLEILCMIVTLLDWVDLKQLNRVSRVCWVASSSRLWAEVRGVDRLFKLMTGRRTVFPVTLLPEQEEWNRDYIMNWVSTRVNINTSFPNGMTLHHALNSCRKPLKGPSSNGLNATPVS
jgi:hypothetical protein